MTLTSGQTFVILAMGIAGTLLTRVLPFILFRKTGSNHPYITDLGRFLPYASIGLLIVYCLRNVSLQVSPFGIPELVSVLAVILLHNWKGNTLLSIGAGTGLYMVLIQTVFH